jgi:hypothetical protein
VSEGNRDGDRALAPSTLATLRLLLQAVDDAVVAQRPATEFAVEFSECRAAGASTVDLRWLVSGQYCQHLIEVTSSTARTRKFRVATNLAFSDSSCFVLTPTGGELARGYADQHHEQPRASSAAVPETDGTPDSGAEDQSSPDKPCWDRRSRRLTRGLLTVKRFRRSAPNQTVILACFDEAGWPECIEDPIPPVPGSDSKRRLRDTIADLNENQEHPLIHFYGDGTGKLICWKLVDPPAD